MKRIYYIKRILTYGSYRLAVRFIKNSISNELSRLYNYSLEIVNWRILCMMERIKKLVKRNLKAIKKIGLVLTSLLLYTSTCFAGVGDSKLATGTTSLINDLTNWLLILAPVLTVLLVGYYLLRKSMSDEMDSKRWDTRIRIALICCIGVVVASGLITVIIGYYK